MVGGSKLNKNDNAREAPGFPHSASSPTGNETSWLPASATISSLTWHKVSLNHNEQEWGQLLVRYLVPIIKKGTNTFLFPKHKRPDYLQSKLLGQLHRGFHTEFRHWLTRSISLRTLCSVSIFSEHIMSLPGTQHACIVIVGQSPCPVYSPSRTHRHCTLKSVSTYTGPSQPGHTVSASFLCSYTCRLSLTFRFSASEQPTLSCIIHRHSIVPFVCQIQTFIHQQINEHFALMCGGTAWQPRVLFGQSCHLCLEEQTLCNYLNFFALCPYYFAKISRKWT